MKRKILFTLALVATACGMTSCSNDEVASSLSQGIGNLMIEFGSMLATKSELVALVVTSQHLPNVLNFISLPCKIGALIKCTI